ncbi:hypothetical protein DEJ49_35560 [Streptomyces venezuelae]|uniref:Uncharacterized protein n=1 Tax=Streptomyces venezuelae TaxID=54571 RepID=A0A5P2CXK9_STRVZ|nr:hypothetical protein DEJ49_35560 [Streptomyces venezuelae]
MWPPTCRRDRTGRGATIASENVSGSISPLRGKEADGDILLEHTMAPGEVLLFVDPQVMHYVSPITPTVPGLATPAPATRAPGRPPTPVPGSGGRCPGRRRPLGGPSGASARENSQRRRGPP